MGNLDGWGGPLPANWHARQLALQQKILKRMRSFGMIAVLPGFAGHIPIALVTRLRPGAKYTNSSIWNGFGDQYRTVLLDPLDPLFKVLYSLSLITFQFESLVVSLADIVQRGVSCVIYNTSQPF